MSQWSSVLTLTVLPTWSSVLTDFCISMTLGNDRLLRQHDSAPLHRKATPEVPIFHFLIPNSLKTTKVISEMKTKLFSFNNLYFMKSECGISQKVNEVQESETSHSTFWGFDFERAFIAGKWHNQAQCRFTVKHLHISIFWTLPSCVLTPALS